MLIDASGVTGSAARGPIQRQRGRGGRLRRIGPKGLIGIGCPTPSRPGRAFALACPSSADSSPRRVGDRVFASFNQHRFIHGPHRLRAVRCIIGFRYLAALSRTCLPFIPSKRFWVWSLPRRGCIPQPRVSAAPPWECIDTNARTPKGFNNDRKTIVQPLRGRIAGGFITQGARSATPGLWKATPSG